MATKVQNAWSKDALLAKSQRFFEEMLRHPRDGWQFAHWSTLALELLARGALANISPALLADQKDWNNVYYALGHTPNVKKFVPTSIGVAAVFNRLREVLPAFTPDMEDFGVVHMNRRNEELHTGDTPFDGLSNSSWLPRFYEACTVLVVSMGGTFDLLVGADEAVVATKLVAAFQDASAKAVLKAVASHKKTWDARTEDERAGLAAQAAVWATRQRGHRVKCPSCNCDALVYGVPIAAPLKAIEGDDITETQQYLPARLECVACGLKISSYAQIAACGLGDSYNSRSVYSAAEYYSQEDEYQGYDEDNNEP